MSPRDQKPGGVIPMTAEPRTCAAARSRRRSASRSRRRTPSVRAPREREVALAALVREMRREEHERSVEPAAQRVRASERLPHRVGAQQSAARARERARHVEVPLDSSLGVVGDEVDRRRRCRAAAGSWRRSRSRSASSSSSASACAALPSLRRARLEVVGGVGRRPAARPRPVRRTAAGVTSSRTRRRAMST